MNIRTLKQSLMVGMLATVMLSFSTVAALSAEYVSIVKDRVNIRSGPSTKYDVLYQLPKGFPLRVLAHKGKWLKVIDYENDKGWIASSLASKTRYVIVKVKEGNVRSGPGTSYDKAGKVYQDVILKRLGQKGDWIKVGHPLLTGWVHKQLIWP